MSRLSHLSRFLLKATVWVTGTVMALSGLIFLGNLVLTARERATTPPPGRMVNVEGHRMHVWTLGHGTRNIVLMTGMGTVAPTVDFRPLAEALAADFRVSVVEPFGYGWSERTSRPRSNEAMVEELRTALKGAGVMPPYLLVPHSVSGLYALYYAQAYPEELSGVVGLDTAVPSQVDFGKSEPESGWIPFQRVSGLLRLRQALRGTRPHPCPDFTAEDMRLLRRTNLWNAVNPCVVREDQSFDENCIALKGHVFPPELPVACVLAATSVAELPQEMPGIDWVKAHAAIVPGNRDGRVVVMEGSHYIHWGNRDRLANLVRSVASEGTR